MEVETDLKILSNKLPSHHKRSRVRSSRLLLCCMKMVFFYKFIL